MTFRIQSSLLSPGIGRLRPIYSGSVELLTPFVCFFNAVPLSRTVITPIVISPDCCDITATSIIRTPINAEYNLSYSATVVIGTRSLTPISPDIILVAVNSRSFIYGSDCYTIREVHYSSELVTQLRNHTWCSEKTALRSVVYQSIAVTILQTIREMVWSSNEYSTINSLRSHSWESIGFTSVAQSRDATWASITDLFSLRFISYKSVIDVNKSRHHTWYSIDDTETFCLREHRYRSITIDSQFIAGNAYIAPDILLVSANVTADEDSPYYQCEVELLHPSDYFKLPRDTAFVLRLFQTDYHFVVDSRSFNREIDSQGNLQETTTISGLSPLCLKASPRATMISKTWDVPTTASAIVTELLGTVTWNLVDWMIPAYRLSVETVDPLTVAQQIVEAAGGLIESQPDGSIVIRHRWPVSITELATVSPDHILHETELFSLKEAPTQDVLMNRIRILDHQASYQDRLEYTPNQMGDQSDPFNGILYAYPSPWRDHLSIVTTRGSRVSLGPLTEGVKSCTGESAETVTFTQGQGSTQYPIMTLISLDWLDDNLGSLSFTPYSTTMETNLRGDYQGHSLGKVEYTSRYLCVPVSCVATEITEAQFLLVENSDV